MCKYICLAIPDDQKALAKLGSICQVASQCMKQSGTNELRMPSNRRNITDGRLKWSNHLFVEKKKKEWRVKNNKLPFQMEVQSLSHTCKGWNHTSSLCNTTFFAICEGRHHHYSPYHPKFQHGVGKKDCKSTSARLSLVISERGKNDIGIHHILFIETAEFHPLPNGTFPAKNNNRNHKADIVQREEWVLIWAGPCVWSENKNNEEQEEINSRDSH